MAMAHGKVCYVEIPATDIDRSSKFYASVFGWKLRKNGTGDLAFDDGIEMGGIWKLGRPPMTQPGLLIYILCDDVAATMVEIVAQGGEIVQPIGGDAPEITARFRDPGGNVLGLYQLPSG